MAVSVAQRSIAPVDFITQSVIARNQSLEAALANELGPIPGVRHILVERADEAVSVWVALDNSTKQVRERVFQKQFDLIDRFPEVSFDFNLVQAKDRTPAEFASTARLVYSREG